MIPVFDKQGTNALFMQRISGDGSIISFDEIDNDNSTIIYVDPVNFSVGEESFWAFAFTDKDIVAERISAFRATLESRINDPILSERPLLSIEVAEFLNLPAFRLTAIKAALDKIGKANRAAAKNWLDLSILTTDLREAIARSNPSSSAYARRIVASTDGNQVVVRSALPVGDSNAIPGFKELVERVLEQLSSVYPRPVGGWKVRFIQSSDAKRKTTRLGAVVLLADQRDWEAKAYIRDDFEWRIDAYRFDEMEDFKAAALSFGGPAFVVFRNESDPVIDEIKYEFEPKITAIQIISQNRLKAAVDHGLFEQPPKLPEICVPMGGFLSTKVPPSTISRIIRQVVAATLSANDQAKGFEITGKFLFFRTTGSGTSPATDAWATLYDRAVSAELSTEEMYTLASPSLHSRDQDGDAIHDLLFPNSSHLRDRRVDLAMSHTRAHAAILLQAKRRDYRDWSAHVRTVVGVLSHRGWRPQQGNDEYELKLDTYGSDKIYILQAQPEAAHTKPYWDFSDLMRMNLSSIGTLAFSADGNAPNILTRLYHHGQLAVSTRDLCGSEARNGLWSILGAQLRRLASGQMNRARSHFMALLINNAFQHRRVALERAGPLEDAIHGPGLGKEVELMWSRVHQTPDETRASVRLLTGMSNRLRQPGSDLIQPFSIALRDDGIHIIEDNEPRFPQT